MRSARTSGPIRKRIPMFVDGRASGPPLLSVLCLTYNHAAYLRQCLESALAQVFAFDAEILVADDASTDKTYAIAEHVAAAHPGRLTLIRRPQNLGLVGNFLATYAACRGRYIAILEGDDYWTHPQKLARQVEFLETHSEYSAVFHDVELLFADGTRRPRCIPYDQPRSIGLEQALIHNYVPNCSALVMRNRREAFPPWLAKLDYYDWPLHVLNAVHGPIACWDEVLSTYRIHGASAWHGRDERVRLEQAMRIFTALDAHFGGAYHHLLRLRHECYADKRDVVDLQQQLAAARATAATAQAAAAEAALQTQALQTALASLRAKRNALRRSRWLARGVELAKRVPGLQSAYRALRGLSGVQRQREDVSASEKCTPDTADEAASQAISADLQTSLGLENSPAFDATPAPAAPNDFAAPSNFVALAIAPGQPKLPAILGGRPCFSQPLHVGAPSSGDEGVFFERLRGAFARRRLSNQGPLVDEFEQRVRPLTGGREVIAVANATLGLQLVLRAFDLSGEVICPSHTFIATAHAIEWEGLTPIFAEVEPATQNLDPADVERKISRRTAAILGVHLWGRPCAIAELTALADRHRLPLIFDAAHAIGCTYAGRPLGDYGDASVFSFHATKVLSAAEGGCIVTDQPRLVRALRAMRNFGFTAPDQIEGLGTNAKLNELNAALALTNLEAFESFVAHNRANYERYVARLAEIPGLSILSYDAAERANYQYVVLAVDAARCGLSRDELLAALTAENILARRMFYPGCHRAAPYATRSIASLPHSERLSEEILVVPNGTAVALAAVDRICDCIEQACEHAAAVRERLERRAIREPSMPRAA